MSNNNFSAKLGKSVTVFRATNPPHFYHFSGNLFFHLSNTFFLARWAPTLTFCWRKLKELWSYICHRTIRLSIVDVGGICGNPSGSYSYIPLRVAQSIRLQHEGKVIKMSRNSTVPHTENITPICQRQYTSKQPLSPDYGTCLTYHIIGAIVTTNLGDSRLNFVDVAREPRGRLLLFLCLD